MTQTPHTWKFFRAGGFDQVQLNTGEDLLALRQLDQKLWVALSCPTRGIEFDNRTLDLIDSDKDGQVRANEIISAMEWTGKRLKNSNLLLQDNDRLNLADIQDNDDEGKRILASARYILNNLGKSDTTDISLADMANMAKLLAGLSSNGDGIICAEHITDTETRNIVEDIIRCSGGIADKSGVIGINKNLNEQFFADIAVYAAWHKQCETNPNILPLGEATETAAKTLQAVSEKITDYFTRCQMAEYDARAAEPLNRAIEDYQNLAAQHLSQTSDALAGFPLSRIEASKVLPLTSGINPAWREKIVALHQQVIQPLLGQRNTLDLQDWTKVCETFKAFETWQAANPNLSVAKLGLARVREILASPAQHRITTLIQQDLAVESEIMATAALEQLLRYKRDLHTLACNFVSFSDFYSGKQKAVFQIGTLYLDGRSCELCIRIDDINSHATYANASGVCLVYCELVRRGGSEKMNIAAAITAGDADFLQPGRHGIFYDRKGQDWLATVVRINSHPISIRQAFWTPYKKLSQTISEQMQKFAASKADKTQTNMTDTALATGSNLTSKEAPKPAFDIAKFAGIFAAIGLAIGAIGGILTAIVSGILGLAIWQIPLALAGLMLAISGPSMALAWFKLKHRNIGPMLDACGWAINARAFINIPFGSSLTAAQSLPPGSHRSLIDPYAEKKSGWKYLVVLVLILAAIAWAWYSGYITL
jgi:hypothetical protein